jgi:hypothetical protein
VKESRDQKLKTKAIPIPAFAAPKNGRSPIRSMFYKGECRFLLATSRQRFVFCRQVRWLTKDRDRRALRGDHLHDMPKFT